ncbi:cation:proton antiporter [Nocardioides marmorisolisilvae]|uniref:Cation:proton antiporter n=1 Tax=Nocardioides marmorisolisilvae TaxID=1542737 RepID=A0A3N0E0E8_9ACTN|nr:cation:proton antiporter [Nocardioides marmorisolisilvae]RNL81324.1 cation:proton antiporter [Nocardioides marmorisolisilvae]
MSFVELSVICLVALLGPLLALPRGWHLPVVLGELLAGIALGRTGTGYFDPSDPTFSFLADAGFALVMFVAGSHVPVRNPALRPALRSGALRAVTVGIVATGLGYLLAQAFDVHHAPLYAVLMASSSAALILPIVDSLGLGGEQVLGLLPQIAIADAACIVALPLVIDPHHAGRAALGAVAVLAASAVVFVVLRHLERSGIRGRVHDVSEDRSFAVELRVQLTVLFLLAGLAVRMHVSIMLAGFAFGLLVAAIGEPRRLAKQLFAVTEGFLGPVFFVWLGATLQLRDLGSHPRLILLGVCLGLGATVAHLVVRASGQPVPLGMLAAAQLGVPVAAATVGEQLGVLVPGEASALMLGALVSIAIAVLGGSLAARRGMVGTTTMDPAGG